MTHKVIEWQFSDKFRPVVFSVMEWDNVSKFQEPVRVALLEVLSTKYPSLSESKVENLTEKSLDYYYSNISLDFSVNQFSDEQLEEYLNLTLAQCGSIVVSMLKQSIERLKLTIQEENVPEAPQARGHLALVG